MTIGQLAAIRARIAGRLEPHLDVTEIAMAVADLRALLDEVDRLNIERDTAFRRGVEAMRNAAARECWMVSDELADIPDMMSEQGAAQHCATRIRALPTPEDKS